MEENKVVEEAVSEAANTEPVEISNKPEKPKTAKVSTWEVIYMAFSVFFLITAVFPVPQETYKRIIFLAGAIIAFLMCFSERNKRIKENTEKLQNYEGQMKIYEELQKKNGIEK